jgi:heme/copper-type cytochrome/quinol oxidase subunit 3
MTTGLHGFHVIIGSLFLIVCLFRQIAYHFTTGQHIGFECAAWYWHFVDAVWIFVYFFLYWWAFPV